jgi:hypothetical protein
MNPAVLALALIRWAEAIRRRYANITGRRAQRMLLESTRRVVKEGPAMNRRAKLAKHAEWRRAAK